MLGDWVRAMFIAQCLPTSAATAAGHGSTQTHRTAGKYLGQYLGSQAAITQSGREFSIVFILYLARLVTYHMYVKCAKI